MNASDSTESVTALEAPQQQQQDLEALLDKSKSLILASVDAKGGADASYSPFVRDDDGNLYIYVSTLAKHTRNLRSAKAASVMIIEDEQDAASLYARRRLTLDCSVEPIERDSPPFEERMQIFQQRFGEIIDTLAGMKDFHLFRLVPQTGRLVLGFGAAYTVTGLLVDGHLRGKHRPSK